MLKFRDVHVLFLMGLFSIISIAGLAQLPDLDSPIFEKLSMLEKTFLAERESNHFQDLSKEVFLYLIRGLKKNSPVGIADFKTFCRITKTKPYPAVLAYRKTGHDLLNKLRWDLTVCEELKKPSEVLERIKVYISSVQNVLLEIVNKCLRHVIDDWPTVPYGKTILGSGIKPESHPQATSQVKSFDASSSEAQAKQALEEIGKLLKFDKDNGGKLALITHVSIERDFLGRPRLKILAKRPKNRHQKDKFELAVDWNFACDSSWGGEPEERPMMRFKIGYRIVYEKEEIVVENDDLGV